MCVPLFKKPSSSQDSISILRSSLHLLLGVVSPNPNGLARAVMPGQGANLAHQDALAHLLESQRGSNVIHVGFF